MSEVESIRSRPRADGQFGIRIAQLRNTEIDAQPFGIIRLDTRGIVLSYNAHEQRQARRSARSVIGRNFFTSVAPCTQVQEFHGRFLEGVDARRLDTTFGFVFPCPGRERHVFITLYFQHADDSIWVITRDTRRRRG